MTRLRPYPLLAALLLAAFVMAIPAATARAATERTGRLLVMLDSPRVAAAALALPGVRRDGAQVPQIGLLTVRAVGGRALADLAPLLRRLPGVRSVEVERRFTPRLVPNDPALVDAESAPGTPPAVPVEWWVSRLNLPAAWDISRGAGATVAVIDTGIDATHPDLVGKIEGSIDNDDRPSAGPATVDENGHGTHVASMACAAGDNAYGIVGAGLDCKLIVLKSDLSDSSVARSIVQAADQGAGAINMSFGTDGTSPAVQPIVEAIDYAVDRDLVLVASAADSPVEEQGDPSNLLQPSGTGADIAAGRGLSVTAADFAGNRAQFAGRGSQISIASFGAFTPGAGGPPGLLGAFPGNTTELETGSKSILFPQPGCACRAAFQGDLRYAYLQGTSMAAPHVAAVAALMRKLNPDLKAPDVIRVLKETATRPAGTAWTPELGWGILDAGRALSSARSIDRRAPRSKLTATKRVKTARSFKIRWSGSDPAPAGLKASGIKVYEVYRSTDRGRYKRIKRTRGVTLTLKAERGASYRFYTLAIDRAGNREAVPSRPDVTTRVDGPRRSVR